MMSTSVAKDKDSVAGARSRLFLMREVICPFCFALHLVDRNFSSESDAKNDKKSSRQAALIKEIVQLTKRTLNTSDLEISKDQPRPEITPSPHITESERAQHKGFSLNSTGSSSHP